MDKRLTKQRNNSRAQKETVYNSLSKESESKALENGRKSFCVFRDLQIKP